MKASYIIIGVIFIMCLIAVYLDIGVHPLRKKYTSDKAKVKYDRNKAKCDKKFKKQQLNNILDAIIKKSNDKSDVKPYITVNDICDENMGKLEKMGYKITDERTSTWYRYYRISWFD